MGDLTPLARSAQIAYVKVARGPIEAKARLGMPAAEALAKLDADGRIDFSVEVEMTDGEGDPVATATVDWNVRLKDPDRERARMSVAAIRMSEVDVWRWVAAEERRAVLLQDLDWTVERGEHWVVLGPNGAGKTTLLNMAAAFSHPSAGTVEVLGERLGEVDMRRCASRSGRSSRGWRGGSRVATRAPRSC